MVATARSVIVEASTPAPYPGVVSNLDASGTIITFEANAAGALREIAPDLHVRVMNISERILLIHFE